MYIRMCVCVSVCVSVCKSRLKSPNAGLFWEFYLLIQEICACMRGNKLSFVCMCVAYRWIDRLIDGWMDRKKERKIDRLIDK